jgi:HPr kinase/phosphorylase
MSLTVRQFVEAGREALDLSVEVGEEYLDRAITQEALNRPGLALTGFFRYFAQNRIQVIGLAEHTYLNSLSPGEREQRLRAVLQRPIPAVVLTRSRHATPELRKLARSCRVPVLRSSMITGLFMNAATVLIEALTAPRVRLHGTTVDIMGIGVMLEGQPGIGKSETALALIERGHSLVADDITVLRRASRNVILATSVDVTRFHMEIRGMGIVHVPSLFGIASMRNEAQLELIIRLVRMDPKNEGDRTGLTPQIRDILGVEIPLLHVPVAPGRDLANVVEVAALNQKLKQLGHDAAKELDEKLIRILTQKRSIA